LAYIDSFQHKKPFLFSELAEVTLFIGQLESSEHLCFNLYLDGGLWCGNTTM